MPNGQHCNSFSWMQKNITRRQRNKTFQFKIQSQKGKEHLNIMRWTQIHLHFCSLSSFNYWHCFSSMDSVRCYGMTIQIPYWSHCWVKHINLYLAKGSRIILRIRYFFFRKYNSHTSVSFSIQFNFVRFHHFLYGFTNITKPHINSSFL